MSIRAKVIRNCSRQDSINLRMFLRTIESFDASERVLPMTMVLPTFPERKVGPAEG
jgi:hypothetical protein